MKTDEDVRRTEISVSAAPKDQTPSGNLDSILVTYANHIHIIKATRVPLQQVVDQIRSSDDLCEKISRIRSLATNDERGEAKKRSLPWFTFSEYRNNYRSNESFSSTRFIVIDIDHIGESLLIVRDRLIDDPDVFMCFISPSGDGLKVIFEVDKPITSESNYRGTFQFFRNLVTTKYGVTTDDDDDPARACFLSSDPDLYINPLPRKVTAGNIHSVRQSKKKKHVPTSGATPGNRTNSLCEIVGLYIDRGFSEDFTTQYALVWNKANKPPLPDEKVIYTVNDMYKRYWRKRIVENCEHFYSYGTDVFQTGLVGPEFFIERIGPRKFYVLTGAADEYAQRSYFEYLVQERHIRHLSRIDHLGAMGIEKCYEEYHPDTGIFTVHYAPLPVKLKDNQFIEDWLSELFGENKTFIKRWLAVYCYTNYRKLPTIILKGGRGTGKNTFAETLMSIFPSISQFWHGEERSFSPEVQKKLLIADETVSANEKQYRLLKSRSGQKMAMVNQKFVPEYQVKNNMNIIILSNEHTPIFVEKHELPSDEKNNQFFICLMPKLKGAIDTGLAEKLEDRLGHYVRTELKDVYAEVKDLSDCRYSIPTPITREERALFDVNMTGLEAEADKFIQKMIEDSEAGSTSEHRKFFLAGWFPSRFLDSYIIAKGYTKNGVVRNLKERGFLDPKDPERPMVGGKREYCFAMTDALKKRLTDEQLPAIAQTEK